jgi:hypothetical protein
VARGEGDETIGPPRQGFLVPASAVYAAGVGLEGAQPRTIAIDVPKTSIIRQTLLYWGARTDHGDDTVQLNGSIAVKGDLIGTSPQYPGTSSVPYVYRADITRLNVVGLGHTEVTVGGLDVPLDGVANGAEIVVLADDGGSGSLELRDGCDFAYWKFKAPVNETVRQKFLISQAREARQAELLFVVGDHKKVDGARCGRARSRSRSAPCPSRSSTIR